MKKILLSVLAFLLLVGTLLGDVCNTADISDLSKVKAASEDEASVYDSEEMRGIWVSYNDFSDLGFYNKSESKYIKNVKKFLKTVKKKKYNVVFLHVRAFDDAIWPSETFPASEYLTKKASRNKTAAETYKYDPLQDFIDVADSYGIEVHAWLNPYRVTIDKFLDPSIAKNQKRVKTAVSELLEYDIDGIHFDDYFYHSQGGYVKSYKSNSVYSVDISAAKKRKYVNKLIKAVYKQVHKVDGLVFGISPQGNYDNDMNSGADVKTWLSKSGYVDYVAPQIYWSDQYGKNGDVTMYSDRLTQFCDLRTNEDVKLYIGLALYRTGTASSYDVGWSRSSTNLKEQIELLREAECEGFIMFSARYINRSATKAEQKNYLKILD